MCEGGAALLIEAPDGRRMQARTVFISALLSRSLSPWCKRRCRATMTPSHVRSAVVDRPLWQITVPQGVRPGGRFRIALPPPAPPVVVAATPVVAGEIATETGVVATPIVATPVGSEAAPPLGAAQHATTPQARARGTARTRMLGGERGALSRRRCLTLSAASCRDCGVQPSASPADPRRPAN